MKRLGPALVFALLAAVAVPLSAATFATNGPTSTNNDDTCDIANLPAATLLLPYFEVDLSVPGGQTTIFTVTNTSNLPQALLVTLWTDRGYPVISFPIFLTGYDVQSINLFDVIRNGRLGSDRGTGVDVSPRGKLSAADNPTLVESSCEQLPVLVPAIYIQRMQAAFTEGRIPPLGLLPGCNQAGGVHANAIGYATIDVTGGCVASLPSDPIYFAEEIRFDNVLVGDYLQVDGRNNFAQGSPMVHIRAIPEGGTRQTRRATNMRRTFYSRLQSAPRTLDARQPLPSTFAARWIEGGGAGFETFFKIWREAETSAAALCETYPTNARMPIAEVVRFDEEENPETSAGITPIPTPIPNERVLPATALVNVADTDIFPINSGSDVGGWIYLNLNDARIGTGDSGASQNWVVTSMRSQNRFSVDMDALSFGNGCTPPAALSNASTKDGPPIGPAGNSNP